MIEVVNHGGFAVLVDGLGPVRPGRIKAALGPKRPASLLHMVDGQPLDPSHYRGDSYLHCSPRSSV